MLEINIKDNKSKYKVFIDELPINELITQDIVDLIANSVSNEIIDSIKSKQKRRNYYLKSKEKNCN